MNIKGKNPTLTAIMIGLMISLTILILTFNVYNDFLTSNNVTTSNNFDNYYGNISRANNTITGLGNEMSDSDSIIGDVYNFISTIVNVFIIGLSTIGKFFGMVTAFTTVFEVMGDIFKEFSALIGLITLITGFYIAMRYIQSARGSTQAS